jgi:hypothetical protein
MPEVTLGSATAQLLCLPGVHLAAPGSSALADVRATPLVACGRLAVSTSDRGNKLSGSGPGHSSLDSLPPGLAYPATFANLAWPCGRSPYALCRIFNATAHHVYGVFEHLRDERSLEAWAPHFEHFAKAIHRGGRRSRRSCRFYPMPLKNCIGFIDGSNQYCDKPGRYQGILYNGHKRAHLVKWQGIMLPNGIMPMPFGPINGRHHDAFMLDRSRVVPVMRRACRRAGRTYQLYGDPAYPLSPWLGAPFPSDGLISGQEARFNKTMSAARIAVEWGFGKIKTNWSYLDFKKGMKPYQSDLQKFWPVAQILTNCVTRAYMAARRATTSTSCRPLSRFTWPWGPTCLYIGNLYT